jgi:phosphoglycolate phosphatase-like HAD superfamily hydrolase
VAKLDIRMTLMHDDTVTTTTSRGANGSRAGGATRTLLLFDIDGTLILTGGAGTRAMTRAFEATCGIRDALKTVDVAGRTDRVIMRDALACAGRGFDEALLDGFRDTYCGFLREELEAAGVGRKGVLPGVGALLQALTDRDDVSLALLTGNFRRSAAIKLEFFGLWRYFAWGVFGEEAFDRDHLTPIALDRHRERESPIDPSNVVVIGDTPHDVQCARVIGARAVAVATGQYDLETLEPHRPDALFADLRDTAAVVEHLIGR